LTGVSEAADMTIPFKSKKMRLAYLGIHLQAANLAQPVSSSYPLAGPIILLARLLFALIFLLAGPRHFMSQTVACAASPGVPFAWIAVPFSGVLAIAGALSILLGYRAKIGAWLLVLFLVCVTSMITNSGE
jgi:uncharacterized membrane protein YphA (DoxX/SURF4 family)